MKSKYFAGAVCLTLAICVARPTDAQQGACEPADGSKWVLVGSDNDGRQDIAVLQPAQGAARKQLPRLAVKVYGNEGQGSDSAGLSGPIEILAGGKPISFENWQLFYPFVGDFDGDGIKDLLVGQKTEGKLRIYRNEGTNKQPRFEGFTWLRDGAKDCTVPLG